MPALSGRGVGRTSPSVTSAARLARCAAGGEGEHELWAAAAEALREALAADAALALQRTGSTWIERGSTGQLGPEAGGEALLCLREGTPIAVGDRRRSRLAVPVGAHGVLIATSGRPFDAARVQAATLVADVLALGLRLRQAGDALERERRRIAGDIHDEPVQTLATAAIELSLLAARVDGAVGARITAALANVTHATRSLRLIMADLLPDVLEREGLAAALRDHLARTCQPSGIDWSLEAALVDEPADEARLSLLRIAQEAVANARTHAGASRIDVRLAAAWGELELRVQDDGIGFDAAGAATPSAEHHGLRSMQERAAGLGGRLEITSRPGEGTVVACRVPV